MTQADISLGGASTADIVLHGAVRSPTARPSFQFGLQAPVVHSTAVRNMLCDAIVDQLDGGSIVFTTSDDVTVGMLTFGNPAFGDAVDGVATANAITPCDSAAGGTISKAKLLDAAGNLVVSCDVTLIGAGGDIQLSMLTAAVGQPIELSSMTYTSTP